MQGSTMHANIDEALATLYTKHDLINEFLRNEQMLPTVTMLSHTSHRTQLIFVVQLRPTWRNHVPLLGDALPKEFTSSVSMDTWFFRGPQLKQDRTSANANIVSEAVQDKAVMDSINAGVRVGNVLFAVLQPEANLSHRDKQRLLSFIKAAAIVALCPHRYDGRIGNAPGTLMFNSLAYKLYVTLHYAGLVTSPPSFKGFLGILAGSFISTFMAMKSEIPRLDDIIKNELSPAHDLHASSGAMEAYTPPDDAPLGMMDVVGVSDPCCADVLMCRLLKDQDFEHYTLRDW